ncbi:unnamed protein product [Parnassius mnemosyne]|uniref:Uncharacterized protein n=1 Tax=Parnassius mnemosyne TaxID=213953 RepID=A0AAV1LJS3_9NEOP
MRWRVGWWRSVGAGWWRVGAALLLLAALLPRVPLHSHLAADFTHLTPHELAHFLADFSNYPKLYADLESWMVEEEAGNYTWWRYSVSYTCGARCTGRAAVWHAAGDAAGGAAGDTPRHGAAPAHRVRVLDSRCTRLPLLPWPQLCEESEVETLIVERVGGGARLEERARGACGALAAAAARCDLPARRRQHLLALRHALPPR